MEQENLYGQTIDWNAPDGNVYTLREQNGADDDILSNQAKSKDLTNLLEFISAIVVKVNLQPKKLSLDEILSLPINVKYGILLKSRIFSLGNILEFEHTWPEEEAAIEYEVDLEQFLFNDYHVVPEVEELLQKEDAIPYYPEGCSTTSIEFSISTGKRLQFDRFNGHSERFILNKVKELSQNKPLEARNLKVYLNGQWQPVQSFHIFTAREMKEIREEIYGTDPVFSGEFTIAHPSKPQLVEKVVLFGISNFFFPGEA